MELLTQLNKQGITVVVITHEAEVAHYASRQIHFRDGKIEVDTASAAHIEAKRAQGG
jgi:ABC-type lipoprotein export system ATPase subunit